MSFVEWCKKKSNVGRHRTELETLASDIADDRECKYIFKKDDFMEYADTVITRGNRFSMRQCKELWKMYENFV